MKIEKECMHEFLSISRAEEAYFKQTSRNKWLQLRDQNNAFFHRIVKVRASKNMIHRLWDDNGVRVVKEDQIKQVGVDFYRRLLGSNSCEFTEEKAERIAQLVQS